MLGDPDRRQRARDHARPGRCPALERSVAALKERDFLVDRGPTGVGFSSPIVPRDRRRRADPRGRARDARGGGPGARGRRRRAASEHAARIAAPPLRSGRSRARGDLLREERRAPPRRPASSRRPRATTRTRSRSRDPRDATARRARRLAREPRRGRAPRPLGARRDRPVQPRDSSASIRPGPGRSASASRVAAGHILAAVEQMEESRQRLAEAKTIAGSRRAAAQAGARRRGRARDPQGRLQARLGPARRAAAHRAREERRPGEAPRRPAPRAGEGGARRSRRRRSRA